jgi:hypothetical protein
VQPHQAVPEHKQAAASERGVERGRIKALHLAVAGLENLVVLALEEGGVPPAGRIRALAVVVVHEGRAVISHLILAHVGGVLVIHPRPSHALRAIQAAA